MLVCEDPSFFYLPFTKTASHTIWKVLSGYYTLRTRGEKHAVSYVEGMEEGWVFASVRCPYSRLVSLYRHYCTKAPAAHWRGTKWEKRRRICKMDLRTFLADPWLRQHGVGPLAPRLRGIPVQHLVRFEHLEEDLARLPVLQGKSIILPHLHRVEYTEPWYSVYLQNPGLAEEIYQCCREDFKTFGYARELEHYHGDRESKD
jgi:hypothetical protein